MAFFKKETAQAGLTNRFFHEFDRFLETSETGKLHVQGREKLATTLNSRNGAMILGNQDAIADKNILDLASHDGRWSFAALKAGARHVTGIEHKPRLIEKAHENFAHYGVDKACYQFIEGDIFKEMAAVEKNIDTVFCFGIFYHINNHMLLLSQIQSLDAQTLIIDTEISQEKETVIELLREGKGLVGKPSRNALIMMLEHYGWNIQFFDWRQSGLIDGPALQPRYHSGRRVTVTCTR